MVDPQGFSQGCHLGKGPVEGASPGGSAQFESRLLHCWSLLMPPPAEEGADTDRGQALPVGGHTRVLSPGKGVLCTWGLADLPLLTPGGGLPAGSVCVCQSVTTPLGPRSPALGGPRDLPQADLLAGTPHASAC